MLKKALRALEKMPGFVCRILFLKRKTAKFGLSVLLPGFHPFPGEKDGTFTNPPGTPNLTAFAKVHFCPNTGRGKGKTWGRSQWDSGPICPHLANPKWGINKTHPFKGGK